MDRSALVIVLALTTLVLVGLWAYYTKRKAKEGLDLDRKRDVDEVDGGADGSGRD